MSYGSPGELAWYIEENQCWSCTHKNEHGSDGDHVYFMCHTIEIPLVLDGEWPDEIEEDEFAVPYCTLYREDTLDEEAAPEQETLF